MPPPAFYRLVLVFAFVLPLYAKICNTIFVTTELEKFNQLQNCTAILGNLSIVLLEKFSAEEFEPYSFPELTEISGYFLVAWVYGLRSIGQLFPNLSVIGGKQLLLENYSFVLYQLLDLKEVGFYYLKVHN